MSVSIDEKKRILNVLEDLRIKVDESDKTKDWRWVLSYDFPSDVFDNQKRTIWGFDFTEKTKDILWTKAGNVKNGRAWQYRAAHYEAVKVIDMMDQIKNSSSLKKNPEWAAIRGHEIDDYLVNGCGKSQRDMTLKFLRPPNMETPWIKNLISLQIIGGYATWDEIKGMSGDPIGPWGGDRLRSILHAGFIEIVKKEGRGKRIFGLTKKGEKAIEYVVSH